MDAIRYYVKGAFRNVVESPDALEQQEELIADLTAKVADFVEQGMSAEEALGQAIASVGDLSALVAEFETAVAAPAPVPTATVYSDRLDFHVVAASVGVGALVMIVSTALGAMSGMIDAGAGLSLLGTVAVGAWWIRSKWLDYQAQPDAVAVREQVYGARFRKALLIWAGLAFTATFVNLVSRTDFWCWPIWVAGGTWALSVKMEDRFSRREVFVAPAYPE